MTAQTGKLSQIAFSPKYGDPNEATGTRISQNATMKQSKGGHTAPVARTTLL
jgi:hypothetical protein